MHLLTGHMGPGMKLKLLGLAASAMNEWAISQAQSTQLHFFCFVVLIGLYMYLLIFIYF